MSRIYDNWERLVAAVLKREQFREMALAPPSAESSFRSTQSDISSIVSSNRHDELAGEIATELLKQLFNIARKSAKCRSSALQLIEYIQQVILIIQEIKHSGNELPQFRQRQLDMFSETLSGGLDLAAKVLNSSRLNVYRNHRLARKMEKLEHDVSRFMNGILHAHVLADVHHVSVKMDARFKNGILHAHALANVHHVSVKMDARFDGLEGRLGIHGIGGSGKTTLAREIYRDEEECFRSLCSST